MKELPECWIVKMYPEVKQWIWNNGLKVYSQANPESYWWSRMITPFRGRHIYYIDEDDIELTREEFNWFILNKKPEEINYKAIDLSQVHEPRKETNDINYCEYTRDPYGYNFLKSRT